MALTLNVNGVDVSVDATPDTPILWVIRDHLSMTGTKFGCGMSLCGACTVHLNGQAIRSCITPVQAAVGQKITTIEGVESPAAKVVQEAWDELQVPQCGYCQSGQVMSAVALLEQNPNPTDDDIDAAMAGNVCRCATYVRIRNAIKQASTKLS
ncbi:(2Fe-2S)-binding protein [Vibrio sp. D404a]|uniref:(2Fe-2S)-binding protein n=1 Tax=Vibrio fortis TaxID=212667 RepID=A0A5N3QTK1_9VIBR|nr:MULTISPECIES: (2Fe-2S)-binding protein [Vibrio]KAB0285498.1 (2Fe-2S)-binding protein [Vibrio fortis]MDK9736072.1 (2Fe-2S)-binding protein [Vibrio sp. D404a]MDK9797762.1 (2Fe-2S)-binding protein [Vibrio sp. D449a]QFT13228.1 Isoquinoline 1-oxidoreductase subunit alpha [Vibrio sp. THAF190c]|tara:strand:+ start:68 stop:526 length:459 start_codon:yes stop_codon:yes gene_type:complete